MTKTWKKCHKRIYKAVDRRLTEHEIGLRELSTGELIQLRGLLDAERPSSYNILNTIINQMSFLNHEYAGEQAHIPVISDFLVQFQQKIAAEMLLKEPTIKQGLALSPDGGTMQPDY